MLKFLARRGFQSVVVLAGLVLAVFVVGHLIGDPVRTMLPPEASPVLVEALREELGLSGTIGEQFVSFLRRAASGFGDSFWQRRPSLEIAMERVPRTLLLAGATLVLAVPAGIVLGVVSGRRPDGRLSRLIEVVSLGGVSTVDFWLGYMLVLVFAVWLGVLPTGGFGTPAHIVLPALALAFRPLGLFAQFTRSSVESELQRPYVELLRAKGLPDRLVMKRVMRNVGVPVFTLAGDELIHLASGVLIIEAVFAWPGVGNLVVEAIGQRDLFLLEAAVFVIGVMVVTTNLLVDLTYGLIDPRVGVRDQ